MRCAKFNNWFSHTYRFASEKSWTQLASLLALHSKKLFLEVTISRTACKGSVGKFFELEYIFTFLCRNENSYIHASTLHKISAHVILTDLLEVILLAEIKYTVVIF